VAALLKAGANASLKTTTLDLTEELARQQAAARKRNELLFAALPAAMRDSAMKAIAKQEAEQAALRRQFGLGVEPVPGADTAKKAAPAAAPRADSVRTPRIGLIAPPVNALTPKQIEEAILHQRVPGRL
jgi:hypothetical protein